MINGQMFYKGYQGSVEYSENDSTYFGKLLNISDLFSYEGKTLNELEKSFIKAVDEYILILKDKN